MPMWKLVPIQSGADINKNGRTALPHLLRKPRHSLGEQHQQNRKDHNQAGNRGGADVEVGVDLLPKMDRQYFRALIGQKQRHRDIVERSHEREKCPCPDAGRDQRQDHAAERHPLTAA